MYLLPGKPSSQSCHGGLQYRDSSTSISVKRYVQIGQSVQKATVRALKGAAQDARNLGAGAWPTLG